MNAAEQLFWGEVRSDKATSRSLAVCYALLIAFQAGELKQGAPRDEEFWPKINRAVNERLGIKLPEDYRKIDRFRKAAWEINSAACDAREGAESVRANPNDHVTPGKGEGT